MTLGHTSAQRMNIGIGRKCHSSLTQSTCDKKRRPVAAYSSNGSFRCCVTLSAAKNLGEILRRLRAPQDDNSCGLLTMTTVAASQDDNACGSSNNLVPVPKLLDLLEQVDHLDGGDGGIGALVASLGAGPLDSLLDGVGGDHPIDHRNAGI